MAMTSFGDDYAELENCGVEFDPTCQRTGNTPQDSSEFEELGECEAEDEACISRLRKKPSGTFSRKSKKGSQLLDKEIEEALLQQMSTHSRIATLTPPFTKTEPLFKGLPNDYYKKNYKPDYPTDLQMKQVCTSKPLRRRTLGMTRTQPKAVFIPSRTTLENQEQKSLPVSPVNAAQNLKTLFPKTESGHAIFREEASPLEQNRLPPPVVSSSDEVIVDWLENHNVQMMFEYFLGLCVINQPENPWTFISELCDRMMQARTDLTAFDNLPRVLTPEHSEAIFRIYDRIENGFITVPQYKSAMDAMGFSRYSTNPDGWEENAISKDTFVKEATDAIDNLLRTFMVFEQVITDEKEEINVDLPRAKSLSGSGSLTSGARSNSKSVANSRRSGSGSYNSENMRGSLDADQTYQDINIQQEVNLG